MAKLSSTEIYGDLGVAGLLALGKYNSVSNVPSNTEEGTMVYIPGDGLYVEDGT